MDHRARRPEVRNPVLGLPSARVLLMLSPETRLLLSVLLRDLAADARSRSRASWDNRKPFVAAYWATVAVYAGHIARLLGSDVQRGRRSFRIVQKGYGDIFATDWAEASRLYCDRRDMSRLGASMFPDATLLVEHMTVGRISYNGRIWLPGEWRPDDQPLYDNRIASGI